MSTFSNYLNELKTNYSFKIIDLARKCAIDTNTVYSWFSGRSTPSSPDVIDLIASNLNLSKAERIFLETAYMETSLGEKKYQGYLMISDLISDIYRECRNPLDLSGSALFSEEDMTEFFFKELQSHNSILYSLQRLFLKTESDDTIFLILNHNAVSLLPYIKDHLFLCGPKKMEILFSFPVKNLFYGSKYDGLLKIICELFIYCDNINIMMIDHDKMSTNITENYIFSSRQFIMFDDELQAGALTNYPEWIDFYKDHLDYWKGYANEIGQKSLSAADYVINMKRIPCLRVYEFMPCFTINLDYELVDNHFYPDIPSRDILIREVSGKIRLTDDEMILHNISSEKGLRHFMDTGIIAAYPFPIYEPFTLQERIMLLDRLIESIEKGIYHQQFHKFQTIEALPMLQLELYESEEISHADIYIIQKDLQVHKIFFYNPQILECIKDFFDVISNPRYCLTEEESMTLLQNIRKEYIEKL